MKNVNEVLKERLEQKRKELKRRQCNLINFIENDITTDCFENNCINELIIMQQLKSEIKELEHCEFVVSTRVEK